MHFLFTSLYFSLSLQSFFPRYFSQSFFKVLRKYAFSFYLTKNSLNLLKYFSLTGKREVYKNHIFMNTF